jgi:hypothetical protein
MTSAAARAPLAPKSSGALNVQKLTSFIKSTAFTKKSKVKNLKKTFKVLAGIAKKKNRGMVVGKNETRRAIRAQVKAVKSVVDRSGEADSLVKAAIDAKLDQRFAELKSELMAELKDELEKLDAKIEKLEAGVERLTKFMNGGMRTRNVAQHALGVLFRDLHVDSRSRKFRSARSQVYDVVSAGSLSGYLRGADNAHVKRRRVALCMSLMPTSSQLSGEYAHDGEFYFGDIERLIIEQLTVINNNNAPSKECVSEVMDTFWQIFPDKRPVPAQQPPAQPPAQQPPAQHRRKLRAKRKTPPTQSINGTPKRRSLEEWTGVACKLHV